VLQLNQKNLAEVALQSATDNRKKRSVNQKSDRDSISSSPDEDEKSDNDSRSNSPVQKNKIIQPSPSSGSTYGAKDPKHQMFSDLSKKCHSSSSANRMRLFKGDTENDIAINLNDDEF